VNVRETASAKAKSLGIAKKGSKLDVYATATVGKVKWYKVKFGTKFGYIHGDYAKLASATPTATKTPVASTTVVKPV
ncbi:SH3 domain-containing protein, partial [Bifidobacterium pseudocatenulatum]|nr:SH3 domain-containing protein [Bifidobacterium pseudocatenulatum]